MSNQGSTPTDRVRAALECITEEHQYIHGQASFLKLQAKVEEIKRELDGMVLVPVEPTKEQVSRAIDDSLLRERSWSYQSCYRAMIAEYRG